MMRAPSRRRRIAATLVALAITAAGPGVVGAQGEPSDNASQQGDNRPASDQSATDSGSGQRQGAAPGGQSADQGGDEQSAAQELQAAYQREYAFLVAQKRELKQRIESFRKEAKTDKQKTQQHIDALQSAVLKLESGAESLQANINDLQSKRDKLEQNANTLEATLQQANATFSEHGRHFMTQRSFTNNSDADKLTALFDGGLELLRALSSVREEPGAFYASDGSKVEGKLVKVGDIATFGIAKEAAGALAPAGGGQLKIWKQPASQDARAVAAGETPKMLGIFLYQSLDSAVDSDEGEGVLATIRSGGTIAWLIVGLGALAALLVLARIVILQRASASTGRIVSEVGEKVRAGDTDGALQICRKRKGATAAVVAAALRNSHREREQLDDLINEAILSQSSHLERFGSLVLVIAAVSPLLGLLGTVTGMISTFDVITEFGTGDPKLLSGGISIALVTTELGLIVAIPALLVGNVLSGWADRIKDDMHKAALRVTNQLEDHEDVAVPQPA